MGGWGGPLRQASTVEDLVGRRKRLHLAAAANLRDELVYGADERAERLGRLLERRRAGTADLLRGAMSNVGLPQADAGVGAADFFGRCWTTLWAPGLTLSAGRVWFEVEVVHGEGTLAVGYAGTLYHAGSAEDVGDSATSWAVCSFGKARHANLARELPYAGPDWFAPGGVLAVAIDLETGVISMAVGFVREQGGWLGGSWERTKLDPARPGRDVGGGLFPVIAGGWGAKVRYNFGHGPMRHEPPGPDYVPVAVAAGAVTAGAVAGGGGVGAMDEAAAQLEQLGVDRGALVAGFDTVLRRHEALMAEDFNDDGAYRKALDQVIVPLLQAHGQASTRANGLCLHVTCLLPCLS